MERVRLLGRDFPVLGHIEQRDFGHCCLCLSAGSDPDSPSFAFKGDKGAPNEDAAVVLRQDSHWLFAVADGHQGNGASHAIIDAFHDSMPALPNRLGQLSLWMYSQDWLAEQVGGTTLLVACLNADSGDVFGLSFGDCTVLSLGEGGARIHNRPNNNYLRGPGPIEVELGQAFEFCLLSGEVLLLHSDGINECCYRDPSRSLQLDHIEALFLERSSDISAFTVALVHAALKGVDGYRGGQDNVAVVSYVHSERDLTDNS